jgi:TPR repeat protein
LFEALVALVQDKYEPVRAMAQLALAPAYEPAAPGTPRRRSPEGGWDKWLAEVKAKEPPRALPPTNLAAHFQSILKAAESGDVAAQSAVGMMFANGKGVAQNYAEAAKWWTKAGLAGDLVAARHAWNLYRNGEGVVRDAATANQLAPLIGEPIQTPRARPPANATTNTTGSRN